MSLLLPLSKAGHGAPSKRELFYLSFHGCRTQIDNTEGIYFITFTCQQWLPLFEITNRYDTVYKWVDYLKTKGHYVNGHTGLNMYYEIYRQFAGIWLAITKNKQI